MFEVKEARREQAPVTTAIIGGTGSGKTLSALKMARGMVGAGGKIVIIDTEGKRSLIYADNPEVAPFLHIDFPPLYSPLRFKQAVEAAVRAGADAVIIDSASHEHEAEGGVLEYADREGERLTQKAKEMAARYNNAFNEQAYDPGFQKWIKPKIEHNRFVRYAVGCPAHVIFCVRQKEVNEMQKAGNKKEVVKVKKPVCDSAFLYEMTLVIELGNEGADKHRAKYVKVPEPFKEHIRNGEIITVNHGKLLLAEAKKGEKRDEKLQALRQAIDDVALEGTESLLAFWKSLSLDDQRILAPYKDAAKQTAADADAVHADEETTQIEG